MRNRLLWAVGAAMVAMTMTTVGSEAASATMVDIAERLYRKATPESFAEQCKGSAAKLEIEGERHSCAKPQMTSIVRFEGESPTDVTVYRKGLHKEVLGQLKRKLGAPSSVKTLGAMKMHFWFTKDASVSVGLQDSARSRSTMVSFRSPK